MTVEADTVEFVYVGDGVSVSFPFPARFLTVSHLIVAVDGVVMSGFSATGAGSAEGGTVTLPVPPAAGAVVLIIRRPPINQLIDFINGVTVLEKTLDNGLDYRTMVEQWLEQQNKRALRTDPLLPADPSFLLPSKDDRAGKYIAFDANGQVALSPPPSYVTLAEEVQTTVQGLALLNVPVGVTYIRAQGYTDPGDGGDAVMKRVAVQPLHPGKVQSADGAWWEYCLFDHSTIRATWFGLGSSNVGISRAAIRNALDMAEAFNSTHRVNVTVPAGNWGIDRTLRVPDNCGLTAEAGPRIGAFIRNYDVTKGAVTDATSINYNNADVFLGNGSWLAFLFFQTTGVSTHDTVMCYKKYGARTFEVEYNYPQGTDLLPLAGYGKARCLRVVVPDGANAAASFLSFGGLMNRASAGVVLSELFLVEGAPTNPLDQSGYKDVWVRGCFPDDYGTDQGTSTLFRVVGVSDVHIEGCTFGMGGGTPANVLVVDRAVGQTGQVEFVTMFNCSFRGRRRIYIGFDCDVEIFGCEGAEIIHRGRLLQRVTDGKLAQIPGKDWLFVYNATDATTATLDNLDTEGALWLRKPGHSLGAARVAMADRDTPGTTWSITARLSLFGIGFTGVDGGGGPNFNGGLNVLGGLMCRNTAGTEIRGLILRLDGTIEVIDMSTVSSFRSPLFVGKVNTNNVWGRIKCYGTEIGFEVLYGTYADPAAYFEVRRQTITSGLFTRAGVGVSAEGGHVALNVRDFFLGGL